MRIDSRRANAARTRHCNGKLLLPAALLALAVLAFGGTAAPAQAAGGSSCSGQARVSSSPVAQTSVSKWDVAKWFGDKAGGALAGRAVNMAFDAFARATGLEKILPETDAAKAVRLLEGIKGQLDDISERIDELSASVGQLITEERQYHLDAALSTLCSITTKQQVLFEQQYVPLVRSGTALVEILAGPNPQAADNAGPNGTLSPRVKFEKLRADFIRVYESKQLDLEAGIREIHAALVPGNLQTSVLAAYGQVLMSKRFLTREDSERLRSLYSDLADSAALASWMAAEFRASSPESDEALLNVFKTYVHNRDEEQESLPLMIPPGVVVDLGQVNATTTNGKPMWFPPEDEDVAWLPSNKGWGIDGIDDVDKEISALNDPKALGKIPGGGWAVPTKAQMTALLSDGCIADPANKAKTTGGACKNAVGPKTGTTVAGYLQRLQPDDPTWQQLFCQSGPARDCAPGVGPAAGGQPPHAFIWTSEAMGQKMKCGWTIIPPAQSSRWYATYSGFRTLANSASQGLFPPLPEKVPGYGLQNASIAYDYCDTYFAELARGAPNRKIPPSPWVSGIVLATRNTGTDDLNSTSSSSVDYMAQRAPRCGGQPATIVGTNRADNLRGTPERDVIVARGGDDVVRALGGNDLVCGNGGADLLTGGRGHDTLYGQRGNDRLHGQRGNDRLHGHRGNDVLRGGPGRNIMRGGPGRNSISR